LLPALQHHFTVGLDALALEFDVDLDFEADWRVKGRQLVSGVVSLDSRWYNSLRNDEDSDSHERELLRLIGRRVGGKARWVEGDWTPEHGLAQVVSRHFTTDRKKVAQEHTMNNRTRKLTEQLRSVLEAKYETEYAALKVTKVEVEFSPPDHVCDVGQAGDESEDCWNAVNSALRKCFERLFPNAKVVVKDSKHGHNSVDLYIGSKDELTMYNIAEEFMEDFYDEWDSGWRIEFVPEDSKAFRKAAQALKKPFSVFGPQRAV
jgi:hypothetical protein